MTRIRLKKDSDPYYEIRKASHGEPPIDCYGVRLEKSGYPVMTHADGCRGEVYPEDYYLIVWEEPGVEPKMTYCSRCALLNCPDIVERG